jgi:hypothetical protein
LQSSEFDAQILVGKLSLPTSILIKEDFRDQQCKVAKKPRQDLSASTSYWTFLGFLANVFLDGILIQYFYTVFHVLRVMSPQNFSSRSFLQVGEKNTTLPSNILGVLGQLGLLSI